MSSQSEGSYVGDLLHSKGNGLIMYKASMKAKKDKGNKNNHDYNNLLGIHKIRKCRMWLQNHKMRGVIMLSFSVGSSLSVINFL